MPDADQPDSEVKPALVTRDTQQRAGIAQLLLVARLKARNRRDLAAETLERAAHVMFVTCKSWFSSGPMSDAEPGADAPVDGNGSSSSERNNKATDAHSDH